MKSRPFKTLSSRIAWTSPWYSVRSDQIRLPDGSVGEYHVVQHPGAVWVVPVTPAGEVVMIHTYRYTVDDWCWEVPAGGLSDGLSPEEAARQELREEIGGAAESLYPIGQFYTANGICNEVGHFFLATGVRLGPTAHEPVEVIQIHRKPIAEALRMARQNEISDAPSLMALLLCEERLRALAR
jgi:ADP-ribose pyrophosphatase